MLYPNRRIETLEKERLQGIRNAEAFFERRGDRETWGKYKDEFIAMSERNFVRKYCQEQIQRYNKFHLWNIMMSGKREDTL